MNPERLIRLDGEVALVTGASSGLGARFVQLLASAGATVIAVARRLDRLEALVEECGPSVIAMPCDLLDVDQRVELSERVDELGLSVTILINNAGVSVAVPAESESLENFERSLALQVTAPFHLAQLFGRPMLERGAGRIINIGSILGLVAASPIKDVSYCASKGALINMTRQLGAEWGRKGVLVNAIAPGWFPTEMTQADMFDDDQGAAFVERNAPMGRAGAIEELDGALMLLAGPGGSYMTGQVVVVDGGWTAR